MKNRLSRIISEIIFPSERGMQFYGAPSGNLITLRRPLKERLMRRSIFEELAENDFEAAQNSYALEMPRKAFIGIGFNPALDMLGERLDILNYFAAMKKLSDIGMELYVWDASSYMILNRASPKKFKLDDPAAIVDSFLDALEKKEEIKKTCDLRRSYLAKAIDFCGIDINYMDSRDNIWQPDYMGALSESLDYFAVLDKETLASVTPNDANPVKSLYAPMEVAEALFLTRYRIDAKLGGEKEKPYDDIILGLADLQERQYTAIRCSDGPRKAGYLSDTNVITTRTRQDEISRLLRDNEYGSFVREYIAPFMLEGEPLEESILRFQRYMEGI
ncbi:MAG: hypothetical protein NDI94_03660 [Candidatus Woesearchaeota archaeon]|nr:hypothetical protein [Candidatus Woesearchaeota archaeon]